MTVQTLQEQDADPLVPIIRLWDSILVPLQGDLTDAQAAALSQDVLHTIQNGSFRALIVDASGLWLVDSHLCSVLADLASAAALMGTRTILSGLRPDVTLTLLTMDITLTGIDTVLNLEQALESLGIGVSPSREDTLIDQMLSPPTEQKDS